MKWKMDGFLKSVRHAKDKVNVFVNCLNNRSKMTQIS